MRVPTLWLYGEWDSSQPSLASVRVLDSLGAIGVPVTARVFTHANHGLMIARGPGGRRFPNFAPGVWDSVFAWMDRQGVRRLGYRE
jgi:dienelactone hydrolase